MSEKRVGLIIILLLVLLISVVWIWYGMKLKKIDRQEKDVYSLTEDRRYQPAINPV